MVPSNASGGLDGVQLKALTADFHEPGFVATLNGENRLDFWFQLSDDDRQQAGVPWGPANPQSLNRYSYTSNSPVKYIDPSGHTPQCTSPGCGSVVRNDSDESVEVQGNRYIQGCAIATYGTECWEYVQVRLDPGEASEDYGITDVDRVRATAGNTINGHSRDDEFEVSDGMRVKITSAATDKQTIFLRCGGRYDAKCIGGRILQPFLNWNQLPGWYTGADAQQKWWKPDKVFLLPSKRDGRYRDRE